MTIRFGAIILSALATSVLAGPSVAETTKLKPKHHHVYAPAQRSSNWQGLSEDFFAGPVQAPGSDNRYFSDTRQPPIRSLGAPFLSEWPD